jgi:hypothetical protein
MYGRPISIPHFEGSPPLPSEVDDEYISDDSIACQPANRLSYMTGFVTITKLFRIFLQGTWMQHASHSIRPSIVGEESIRKFVVEALAELRDVKQSLPPLLQPGNQSGVGKNDIYATQAANICITALCLELYLASSPHPDAPD